MPRRFKLLIFVLLVSNIGVGSGAFYSLRLLDRKYSELVSRAVPSLNDLQTLTALAVDAMRQTNPNVLGAPPVVPEKLQRAREAIGKDGELRAGLLRRTLLGAQSVDRVEFERTGEEFTSAANHFVDTIGASPVVDANRQRDETLRPAFERYLIATTKFADAVEVDSLQTSDALTVRTGSLARMMFAAANWPLALLLVVLLVSGVIVLFVARSSLFVKEEQWRT